MKKRNSPCHLHIALFVLLFNLYYNAYSQTALMFDGSSSYIQVHENSSVYLATFTLECWIKPLPGGTAIKTGANSIKVYPLFSRGTTDPDGLSGINYLLGLRAPDKVLFFEFESAPEASPPLTSQNIQGFTSLRDHSWYHVALSYDGYKLKLYLNGILESMVDVFLPPYSNTTGDLGIACSFSRDGFPKGFFSGQMDALRIYNTALDQETILQEMNSEALTGIQDLVLGMDFNEGAGSLTRIDGILPPENIDDYNLNWIPGAPFNALLPPLINPEPVLKIGVISDPQYADRDVSGTRFYRETLNKLPLAVDRFNQNNIDFALTLGDIIDINFESFDSILPLYNDLEAEHYIVLGNHDFEFEDSLKSGVLEKLGLPNYYYAFDKGDWKFLVLDGTELAEYTSVLHPELAEEADSIRNTVIGQINDKPWNGGISRTQQGWMREQIELAASNEQKVMLLCHLPLLPDSIHLNLWNRDAIVELMKEYDNVIAYLNGHYHYGGYDYRNNQHFLTHYGMLETLDTNSYSILNIYPSHLEFEGFGFNPDRILRYTDPFKTMELPRLDNTTLNYFHDSADFIALPYMSNQPNEYYNYGLVGDANANDNELFIIRNDSLFLSGSPDYLQKDIYSIQLASIDYLSDMVSTHLNLVLDPRIAIPKKVFPDTSLLIGSDYILPLDSFITDLSKNGLEYLCEIEIPEVVHQTQTGNSLYFHPLKFGTSEIRLIAFDAYTETELQDTFFIKVLDPDNVSPNHMPLDQAYVHFEDSLHFQLDTLFNDANADVLNYAIDLLDNENLYYELNPDNELSIWSSVAQQSSLGIIADDSRGGVDTLILDLKFNTPPIKTGSLEGIFLAGIDNALEILLDTLYSDPDHDALFFEASSSTSAFSLALIEDLLLVEALEPSTGMIIIQVDDHFGGILLDSLHAQANPDLTDPFYQETFGQWKIFPNPASHKITLYNQSPQRGEFTLQIFDAFGQLKSRTLCRISAGNFSLDFLLSDLPGGVYYLSITSGKYPPQVLGFTRIAD